MPNRDILRGHSKVLIVADQPVVRYGLARLLSQELDLEVCGEAADASGALHEVEALRPDLALLSMSIDGASHPGLIEQLKAKHSPLKILAAILHDDSTLAGRILHAGADGCIHWGESITRIVEAMHVVLRDELYVANRMAKKLLRRAVEGKSLDDNPSELLSGRELDVFTMIGQGLTTQQIAQRLDLSPRTIESHRKKIKMKLGLQNSVQLSRCGFQWWRENS